MIEIDIYKFFIVIYTILLILNYIVLKNVNAFQKSKQYNNSDDWLIIVPGIHIATLIILIVRWIQLSVKK